MKHSTTRTLAALFTLVTLTAIPTLADTDKFTVDSAHSSVSFKIRHFVSQVMGRFNDFSGTVMLDPNNLKDTKVDFVVQVDSVDTANQKRDGHLKSEDFFNVEKYPTMSFKSTGVSSVKGKTMQLTGDLTIHGTTKRVTVPVRVFGPTEPDGDGSQTVGFSTQFPVSREAYGVDSWTDASNVLGDEVNVDISVEAHSNWKE